MATTHRIRRSTRARSVRVTVEPDGAVVVTLPTRAPRQHADDAVSRLAPWIERRRRELHTARQEVACRPGHVPFLGEELALVPEPGRTTVRRHDHTLRVPAHDPLPALERFYRTAARIEIAPRLDAACDRAGVAHAGLTIRGQKTRWASCSSSGRMSFNWRLLLAPVAVLDYVVEHEVCHLEVMDHSPGFWSLLERRVPGWREQAEWLRRYGTTLVL